jgi:hypothetical protein
LEMIILAKTVFYGPTMAQRATAVISKGTGIHAGDVPGDKALRPERVDRHDIAATIEFAHRVSPIIEVVGADARAPLLPRPQAASGVAERGKKSSRSGAFHMTQAR